MNLINTFLQFWWIFLFLIPVYFIYKKYKAGQGFASFGYDETRLLLIYIGLLLLIFIFQKFIFVSHWYLLFYIVIFIPIFSAFIYILLLRDNVFIIESTMDCEIFYDIGSLEKRIGESTRTRAFAIDRDAYREIKHVGNLDYQYWNGGDGVKFTDYFDEKSGVMYHPSLPELHNISFFIAKSFWLRMKLDLPDLMRQNAMLTWLAPYKTAYEQTKLAKNFKLRLRNIERQYADEPFSLPDDIRVLWEREIEARRRDREAGELKIPEQTAVNAENGATGEPENTGGEN